jgi:hypothetical protein
VRDLSTPGRGVRRPGWARGPVPGGPARAAGVGPSCGRMPPPRRPGGGAFTADVRALYAPVGAEWPPRVANDLVARGPGVPLRSRGAQGLIDRTAQDLPPWQAAPATQEAAAVADV